jgi:hypothetical protein
MADAPRLRPYWAHDWVNTFLPSPVALYVSHSLELEERREGRQKATVFGVCPPFIAVAELEAQGVRRSDDSFECRGSLHLAPLATIRHISLTGYHESDHGEGEPTLETVTLELSQGVGPFQNIMLPVSRADYGMRSTARDAAWNFADQLVRARQSEANYLGLLGGVRQGETPGKHSALWAFTGNRVGNQQATVSR